MCMANTQAHTRILPVHLKHKTNKSVSALIRNLKQKKTISVSAFTSYLKQKKHKSVVSALIFTLAHPFKSTMPHTAR